MKDYSYCQDALRFYGGSEMKKSLIIDDEIYMIKFPKHIRENEKKDLSYSNNIYSEYIGCHILEILGFEVQKTMLGIYKGKEVVLCKDFIEKGYRLFEFSQIKNSIESTEGSSGYGTELTDVIHTIETQNLYPVDQLKTFFWNLFIADALIGNFDRHNGNWGFLINEETKNIQIAPIYDCGSCLYPKLSDAMMLKYLSEPEEIDKRIYTFPNSALKINGKKINYYEFIVSDQYAECSDALIRIMNRIDLDKIQNIIEKAPGLSDIRKTFYNKMLRERFERIIKEPAIEIELRKEQECDDYLER